MTSQLRYVVDELNFVFPGKNYNVIAFDSLNPDQYLQVISNVLAVIEDRVEIDTRDESRDITVKRILHALHVLKYKTANVSNLELAQSLLLGDKSQILPILEWLLQQRSMLQKRAYLARFLTKVEIPTMLRGEPGLEDLYENYEQLMEAFKEAHRERESLLASNVNTAELRGDLTVMEKEKEIVSTKVASLQKSRVDGSKSAAALLAKVQGLREVRTKLDTLMEQKNRLQSNCSDLERFVSRTKQQVTEARRAAQGVTPQGLLQRAEEERRVSIYIAEEKLPADLEAVKKQLAVLRQVTAQTGLSRGDLAQVEQQVRTLAAEVNGYLERRLAAAGPAEDKLAPFRQQAAMLGRRKEAAAEALGMLKKEAGNLRVELADLQAKLAQSEGSEGIILGEDQFKAYVVQLRARTEVYKARRSQLSSQAAECGVLARTIEILRGRQDAAHRVLAAEEARLGLSGFTVAAAQLEEVSAAKAQLDTKKEISLETLSRTIIELNQIIASKKSKLAPAIQELRPLREQYHITLADYSKLKQLYDTTAANLGSATNKLEQEVKLIKEEAEKASSQCALTEGKLEVALVQQESLGQELALYAGAPNTDKSKSMREQLNAKLAEEERRSRQLKEAQRRSREQEPKDEHQMQLWQNVQRIFEAKAASLQQARQNSGVMKRELGAETLVLPNREHN